MLSPISISILSADSVGNTNTNTLAESIGDTFAATFTDIFCCCNLHPYLHYLDFPGE